jgi:hypothetical protein
MLPSRVRTPASTSWLVGCEAHQVGHGRAVATGMWHAVLHLEIEPRRADPGWSQSIVVVETRAEREPAARGKGSSRASSDADPAS